MCGSSLWSPGRRRRILCHPAPSTVRDQVAAVGRYCCVDYDIAAEILDSLDAEIDPEDLEDADPFEEGDLGLLSDVGLPEAALGVILDQTDLYADEQLGHIAREMGFAEQLSALIDCLGR